MGDLLDSLLFIEQDSGVASTIEFRVHLGIDVTHNPDVILNENVQLL